MTILALVLIFLPVALAVYAYGVYPAILWVAARRGRGVLPVADVSAYAPHVTIVIPAYNEAAQIRGAIEAMLRQDYPADRRQILVLSDASTDATDSIVREYASQGVDLLRMQSRVGKTEAENESVAHIRGEVVINTDASIRLHASAVRSLVAAMATPEVGVASSRDVSVTARATPAESSDAEAGYVGYEMKIRTLETALGGIVGASGSGYAIRFDLHRHPVRPDLSRDFSAALTARRHGLRAVSVDQAVCYVPRTPSLEREYRRKVRTISRGMRTLFFNRDLLLPRHGLFAWKLFSHKVCRWLVPVSALPAVVGLAMLAPAHAWSRWAIGAAAVIALLALVGAFWPDDRQLPRVLPRGLLGALAANLAVIHAAWRFSVGHEARVWEPTRRAHGADAA